MQVQNNIQNTSFGSNVLLKTGVRRLNNAQIKDFLVKRDYNNGHIFVEPVKQGLLVADLTTNLGKILVSAKKNFVEAQPHSKQQEYAKEILETTTKSILESPQTKTVHYDI